MAWLADWYTKIAAVKALVFRLVAVLQAIFQFALLPMFGMDMEMHDIPFWSYFCQISDSTTSYGSYSGAVCLMKKSPGGKLDITTPKFIVESDATIVAPLIFAWCWAGNENIFWFKKAVAFFATAFLHIFNYYNTIYFMKLIITISLLLLLQTGFAQLNNFTRPDFKTIEAAIKDKNSPLFYSKLMERYKNNDTTLTNEEYRYLYYGYSFQTEYSPYGRPSQSDAIKKHC